MPQIRILVVDDEPQIQRFLKPSLTAAGYHVLAAQDGAEALKAAATQAPDLVLLDLGLPDIDGKEIIRRIRSWSQMPIIVLSARDREAEKIEALDLGADDYINKPFGIGELMARIRTALRRGSNFGSPSDVIAAGPLQIDLPAHAASLEGEPLKLTPKEFELLVLLARHPGKVLTHRHLLSAVWGPAHTENLQYLRVLVGQLRHKLAGPGTTTELIETEPGIGYRLRSE